MAKQKKNIKKSSVKCGECVDPVEDDSEENSIEMYILLEMDSLNVIWID